MSSDSKMRLVYVAGPYRGPNSWVIEQNIHRARQVGAQLSELGVMPVSPHANTAHFDGVAPDSFWLEGTLELLRRCDAVVMVVGWEASSGSRGEFQEARRLGIPVYLSVDDFKFGQPVDHLDPDNPPADPLAQADAAVLRQGRIP